ncbi:DddA-like double-stranded DNA deaminase toxin [Saccharopolyspora cebuensis]|uniref:DddA-like double-stranded DNA deaminase toxin n=1 Tax=Saccharopolyspora cebuensis TaxID=418759 RepID=A0ABV4CLW9_9PSEU
MASAIEKVGQVIADAIRKIGAAADDLTRAMNRSEQGDEHLGRALRGTTDHEMLTALHQRRAVSHQLAASREQVRDVANLLEIYRQAHGIPGAEPAALDPSPVREADWMARRLPSTAERSELPRPPRSGKTHGRWLSDDGDVVMLESGRGGAYYETARRRAVELGLTYGRPNAEAAIARHVEVQFAMRMDEQKIDHAEIEINRRVCGTTPGKDDDLTDTCDKQLERFLPPGTTLRVKDGSSPNGRLYRGKEGNR